MLSDLQFTIGAELEIHFVESGSLAERECYRQGLAPVMPGGPLGRPTDSSYMRAEIERTYATLTPASEREAAIQQRWLGRISQKLTPQDVVNYLVYAATSSPGFGRVRYMGRPYGELTKGPGKIEFRGPGSDQDGWYNHSGASVIHLSPAVARHFTARRTRSLKAIGRIAASEGHRTFLAAQHTIVSPFIGRLPILYNIRETPDEYKSVVAGLATQFAQGALLNPYTYPDARGRLTVGPWEDRDIQILPGRIKFRGEHRLDQPDYTNVIRFALLGIRHGLLNSSREQRNRITMGSALRVVLTEGYSEEYLPIMRVLASCVVSTDRKLRIVAADKGDSAKTIRLLLGEDITASDAICRRFITTALRVSSGGYVFTTDSHIANFLNLPAVANGKDRPLADSYDVPAINAKLRRLRVTAEPTISHVITA
jgi:hypothetical protein